MANKKRARPPHTSPVAKNSVTIEPLPVKVGTAIPTIAAPPEKTKDVYKDHHSLTARISAVELVLIQADTLGWKMNGDGKATHKILQRYVDDFNSLTKAIDDAIAANKASEIISSLELLRPYLEAFGMNGTTKMVDEIKLEGANVKVNKMLSRVFQIRNHARRALDEAKAILEKVSL
jgi:hypothetical protein